MPSFSARNGERRSFEFSKWQSENAATGERLTALMLRTSVFAADETLGAGGIHCAAVGGFAALRMRRTPCG